LIGYLPNKMNILLGAPSPPMAIKVRFEQRVEQRHVTLC